MNAGEERERDGPLADAGGVLPELDVGEGAARRGVAEAGHEAEERRGAIGAEEDGGADRGAGAVVHAEDGGGGEVHLAGEEIAVHRAGVDHRHLEWTLEGGGARGDQRGLEHADEPVGRVREITEKPVVHHEAGRAPEAIASAVAEGEVDQGDTVAVAEAESDEV